jgi:hypothetical protein
VSEVRDFWTHSAGGVAPRGHHFSRDSAVAGELEKNAQTSSKA